VSPKARRSTSFVGGSATITLMLSVGVNPPDPWLLVGLSEFVWCAVEAVSHDAGGFLRRPPFALRYFGETTRFACPRFLLKKLTA
jgi:hypothetical protein